MNNPNSEDFSNFIKKDKPSRKQGLIDECKKLDVSIYIDDPSETTEGVYSNIRAVASEAELDRRLNAKKSLRSSKHSKIIAFVSLMISLIALIKSFSGN